MKLLLIRLFPVMLIAIATALPHSASGQTPNAISQSDRYYVAISMDKDPAYDAPSVLLVIKNISDKRISTDDCRMDVRVWVQGEHGEPPTTERERDATSRLRPGDHPLMCDLNVSYSIDPGETLTKHIPLKFLYDLQEPGKYSVYLEFPVPEGWLRSNTTQFEITQSSASQK